MKGHHPKRKREPRQKEVLKAIVKIKRHPSRWEALAKELFKETRSFRPHKAAGILFLRLSKDKEDLEGIFGVDKDDLVKLPGGKAEFGEDPWKTAVREVREETSTAILPAKWKGHIALRSCYYQPAGYTLFVWFPFEFNLNHDGFVMGELKSLGWRSLKDPSLTPWIKKMLASPTMKGLLKSFLPKSPSIKCYGLIS